MPYSTVKAAAMVCQKTSSVFSFKCSSATAAVILLEIEKSSSQLFFLSLTPLMQPYIVKMT
jgi:hypothetical protein